MTSCTRCGASIRWVQSGDERVPLEVHESFKGPHRYVERDGGLVAVKPDAEIAAAADHRKTCQAGSRL